MEGRPDFVDVVEPHLLVLEHLPEGQASHPIHILGPTGCSPKMKTGRLHFSAFFCLSPAGGHLIYLFIFIEGEGRTIITTLSLSLT